jgi:hypothetical protein
MTRRDTIDPIFLLFTKRVANFGNEREHKEKARLASWIFTARRAAAVP